MNTSESHLATNNAQSNMQQSTQENISSPNRTPLYDMLAPKVEPLLDVVLNGNLVSNTVFSKFANMFSFQLVLLMILMVISWTNSRTPILLSLIGLVGAAFGFYSVATRDPIGMLIYSVLNLIGFGIVSSYLNYGYALIGMVFMLLLLNQILSIRYLIAFGKEKMKKKQELIETLSVVHSSNV